MLIEQRNYWENGLSILSMISSKHRDHENQMKGRFDIWYPNMPYLIQPAILVRWTTYSLKATGPFSLETMVVYRYFKKFDVEVKFKLLSSLYDKMQLNHRYRFNQIYEYICLFIHHWYFIN